MSLFTEEAKDRIKSTTADLLEEVKTDIEEAKGEETKSGRKTKSAKQAEEAEVWRDILTPILSGLNSGVARYAKELSHSDEEIQVIATLSGKIAPKYFDIEMMKYKDEYQLIAYLIMIETTKIQKYLATREDRKESKGNNNGVRQTGKRENAPDKKADNTKLE